MKKLALCIGAAVLIAIAAINVNLALNSDKSFVNLSLEKIVSLAKGEGDDPDWHGSYTWGQKYFITDDGATYGPYDCCVDSVSQNACDFSAQADICEVCR